MSAQPSVGSDPTGHERGVRPAASVRRDLVTFGVLTFALAWIPWFVLRQLHVDIGEGAGLFVFALAASSPSLAALIMRIAGRRRPVAARTRPSFVWPLAALVVAVVPPLVAAVATHLGDLSVLPVHSAATIASVGGPLVAFGYTMVSGPLSEEFGWRGFAQPRLRLGLGRVRTALVLGLCWGLWHLPLFFLPGTGQRAMGIASTQGVLFFVGLLPLTYTFLFVSEHLKGGVWAGVTAHATWNLSDALLPNLTRVGSLVETATVFLIAVTCHAIWNNHHKATRQAQ